MASQWLQDPAAPMREDLFEKGYLDEQFVELEKLQDDASPNFVEDILKIFFADHGIMNDIEQALEKNPLDFEKMKNCMQDFKVRSSSMGAAKVATKSQEFIEHCKGGNVEGCKRSFEQLRREFASLMRRIMEYYFQLERKGRPEKVTRPM